VSSSYPRDYRKGHGCKSRGIVSPIIVLIKRLLLSIVDMIRLGFIGQTYQTCIFTESSNMAQNKRIIWTTIPHTNVVTASSCVALVRTVFVLQKSWGYCFKKLPNFSYIYAAVMLGLGICSTILRTLCIIS
jgi:hypothetical protein